ncbi:MAG: hypothetical protein OEZ57_11320, partial [Nitrospirota bacterium]|nr:hypothetical protein [Nitrospirota bacterium]
GYQALLSSLSYIEKISSDFSFRSEKSSLKSFPGGTENLFQKKQTLNRQDRVSNSLAPVIPWKRNL